jgi:hypothetical protein
LQTISDPFLQFGSIDQAMFDLLHPSIPVLASFAKVFRPLVDPIVLFLSGNEILQDLHKKVVIGKDQLYMDSLGHTILSTLSKIHETVILP